MKKDNIKGGEVENGNLKVNNDTCCGKCGCKKDWRITAITWTGVVLVVLIGKLVGC